MNPRLCYVFVWYSLQWGQQLEYFLFESKCMCLESGQVVIESAKSPYPIPVDFLPRGNDQEQVENTLKLYIILLY